MAGITQSDVTSCHTSLDDDCTTRHSSFTEDSTKTPSTSEESEIELDAGLALNIHDDDEVEETDSKRGCLIVFAGFILLTCNSLHITLQGTAVEFLNKEQVTQLPLTGHEDPSGISWTPQPGAIGNNFPKSEYPSQNYPNAKTNDLYSDLTDTSILQYNPYIPSDVSSTPRSKSPDSEPTHMTKDGYQFTNETSSGADIRSIANPVGIPGSVVPTPAAESLNSLFDVYQKSSRYDDMELELELYNLHYKYLTGDHSVAANITSILKALNRSDEAEFFLNDNRFGTAGSGEITKGNDSAGTDLDTFLEGLMVVADIGSPPSQVVSDTYESVFGVFGIVSASFIILTGHRWVAVFGSGLICLGCLGAAYCDRSNGHLVAFLYGALPGIGENMVSVSCTVAILEHFRKRRLVALLLPHIGVILSSMVMALLAKWLFPFVQINSWKSYLLLQTGVTGVMVPFCLLLKPLNLLMKGSAKETLVSRMLGIDGLKIFRSARLYTFAVLAFGWEGGVSVIIAKLPSFKALPFIPIFSTGQMLVVLLMFTSLIGSCITCCMPKELKLRTTLIIMIVFCLVASVLSIHATLLYNPIYAVVYSGLLGVFKGVTDPVLEYAIPLLLGENNVAIGTGVLTTSRGLSAMTMTTLADKIETDMEEVDWCFYLTGMLFFTGFLFAIWTCRLSRFREGSKQQYPRKPSPDASAEEKDNQSTPSPPVPAVTGDRTCTPTENTNTGMKLPDVSPEELV